MKVLVIAPHPDDESFGCGGALIRHAKEGDEIHVVYLSSGEYSLRHLDRENAWKIREREAESAAEVLGVTALTFLRQPDWFVGEKTEHAAERLARVLGDRHPDQVYLPHSGDWHPDHQAAEPIVARALTTIGVNLGVSRRYEVWTPLPAYDYVADITDLIETKLAALDCYRSQSYFKLGRAAEGLAAYRGAMATRTDYAEVFAGWFVDDSASA
jgi:LmbE family N-acetylglucosaminyl deacetylase